MNPILKNRWLIALASTIACTQSHSTVTELQRFDGDAANSSMGYHVANVGDVNNDNVTDFMIGGTSAASKIISGATKTTLYTLNFDREFDGVGDVNNDNHDDVATGNQNDLTVSVISGANGLEVLELTAGKAGDLFGYDIAGAGNVNNDNYDDIIVGAPGDDDNGASSGTVYVFSGENGNILHELHGIAGSSFGLAVSTLRDINNDNHDDFVVGAAGEGTGAAYVYSGKDGSLLKKFSDPSYATAFGHKVSEAGDVNNDNIPDIAIGTNSNRFYVFSGSNYALLFDHATSSGGSSFGGSPIDSAGDVNGDNHDDIVIGSPKNSSNIGSIDIISGATGEVLDTVTASASDTFFGFSVAGVGDQNNDGKDDVLVGALYADNNGNNSGSAYLFTIESDPSADDDNDTLTNGQEATLGTNPNFLDTDYDGINDGDEVAQGTDPLNPEEDVIVGFEDGLLPHYAQTFNVDSKNNPGWEVTASESSIGTYSLKAKAVGAFEFNSISFAAYFSGTSNLVFDYKTESTFGIDGLALYIDGVDTQWRAGGSTGWLTYDEAISAGIHIITLVYGQNGNNPTGRNTAWIDNIRFKQAEYLPSDDMDGDGLFNAEEDAAGTYRMVADSDSDGLTDGDEVNLHFTNPLLADTDSDGIDDGTEISNGTNPKVQDNPQDSDEDGLTDGQEATLGTDPNNRDSDNDGLTDGEEVNSYSTNPLRADTDGDGYSDREEINAESDPTVSASIPSVNEQYDADNDGLSDDLENALGTDVNNIDTDNDGIHDGHEFGHGTDPLNIDSDGDGEFDGEEIHNGSDPLDSADVSAALDSDGDGLSDDYELSRGMDPERTDPDGDGLNDYDELVNKTNFYDADTDGDGINDGTEVENGTDPLDGLDNSSGSTGNSKLAEGGSGGGGGLAYFLLAGFLLFKRRARSFK